MKSTRRLALGAAVAVVAAGAGIGWGLRRQASDRPGADDDRGPAPAVNVFGLRFEQPGGGELALSALRGRPLVLNFWATWCPPCVEEMPMLDRFQREYAGAGWQVVGLAVDSAAPVREFLARHAVGFTIGLAGIGVALSRSLGNTSGSLPFSAIFDRSASVVGHKLGALQWDELTAWAGSVR